MCKHYLNVFKNLKPIGIHARTKKGHNSMNSDFGTIIDNIYHIFGFNLQ